MRILTVFARHGTTKYPRALEELVAFQKTRLPKVRHDIVVVDNDLGATPEVEVPDRQILAGSNRVWEFSAWDEGLAHVGDRVRDYDYVHLVTSAFRTLYTRYIDRIDQPLLERVAGRGLALGHIDYYNTPIVLLGNRTQAWIRSSFFFTPPTEIATLGPFTSIKNGEEFFSGNPEYPFRQDAPISENYRQYIIDWLTGPGTGQGVIWHSRFTINKETLPYFEAKVIAMLNEQMLSIRFRRQGCSLVDATWLATGVDRAAQARGSGPIPDWRVQLSERDTDAVPVPPK
jgi:hypothetical protein